MIVYDALQNRDLVQEKHEHNRDKTWKSNANTLLITKKIMVETSMKYVYMTVCHVHTIACVQFCKDSN